MLDNPNSVRATSKTWTKSWAQTLKNLNPEKLDPEKFWSWKTWTLKKLDLVKPEPNQELLLKAWKLILKILFSWLPLANPLLWSFQFLSAYLLTFICFLSATTCFHSFTIRFYSFASVFTRFYWFTRPLYSFLPI